MFLNLPPLLSASAIGSAITASIAATDLHSGAVIISAVATTFAAFASILGGFRRSRKKNKKAAPKERRQTELPMEVGGPEQKK